MAWCPCRMKISTASIRKRRRFIMVELTYFRVMIQNNTEMQAPTNSALKVIW